MKISSLFFLMLIGFNFSYQLQAQENASAQIHPNEVHLKSTNWTAEDFQNLSTADKKLFIKEIRQIIVSLNEKSELFSEMNRSINPSFISNMIQMYLLKSCLAFDDLNSSATETASYKTENYIQASKLALDDFQKNIGSKKNQLTEDQVEKAKSALAFLLAEAKRIEKTNDVVAKQKLTGVFESTKKIIDEYSIPSAASKTIQGMESIFYRINQKSSKLPSDDKSQSQNKASSFIEKADRKKSTNESTSEATSKATSKAKANEKTAGEKKFDFAACLYAGFVIEDVACRAPKTLPRSSHLDEIFDSSVFHCQDSEVICNPILFGFEGSCYEEAPKNADELNEVLKKNRFKDPKVESIQFALQKDDQFKKCYKKAKPVCVMNSVNATASCLSKTKSEKYLDQAVELVEGQPKLIEDFVKSLNRLCDQDSIEKNRTIYLNAQGKKRKNSEFIKNDILKTCQVAVPRLEAVLKEFKNKANSTKNNTFDKKGNGIVPFRK